MTILVEAGREAELQEAMQRHPAGKHKFPHAPGDQEILDRAYANLSQHIENTFLQVAHGDSPEERWWNLVQWLNRNVDHHTMAPYLAAAIVRLG